MTYDINIALTQGGPFNSTELVAMRVYNKAFISEQYGIGQAEAFILFLMVVIVTMFQVYFSKKAEVEV
jgi:raffinose/stachyose/melibiose transport system permease protein